MSYRISKDLAIKNLARSFDKVYVESLFAISDCTGHHGGTAVGVDCLYAIRDGRRLSQ